MAAAVCPSARGSACAESLPATQPISRRKKPYPWSDMLNRRVVFNCCWRSWIEYGSSNESCSKGVLTKDEFNKALDKQHSSRLRDSRELEAFWSAFCANSGIIGGDGLECNLRFFREGTEPSWEGSGAHGKFTYSTKKRYTKVKLFALLRTVVLEVLSHSADVCGVVLSCRGQKDFISVWNMSPEVAVQRKTLDELMSVLDITASTDCIHYLAFGDLLPGDMRQKIAARSMQASVQRHQIQMKEEGQVHQPFLGSCSHFSACAPLAASNLEPLELADVSVEQRRPLSRSDSADDDAAIRQGISVSRTELPKISCQPALPSGDHRRSPGRAWRVQILCVPLAAAAIWWLWSGFSV